jgi:hypothetical protein
VAAVSRNDIGEGEEENHTAEDANDRFRVCCEGG